jgi:hypothetical protein
VSPPAAEALRRRALAALRAEVGRRAEAGRDDAGLGTDRLAALLEIDAAGRQALTAAAEERRRRDPYGEAELRGEGPRALREWRLGEAHRTIGELVLAGELVPDGPGQVALPGFGRGTWQAVAEIRAGAPGAVRAWAVAVAAGPARDLGEAAPAFLRDLRPDPRLGELAAALHAVQALRQDLRDRVLHTEQGLARTLDRGRADAVEALRHERLELELTARELDAAVARAWRQGAERAVRYARRP